MPRGPFAAFLIAQVGAHAARRFAEAIQPLNLTPPDAGIIRLLAQSSGLSQRDLSDRLGIHPSRLVGILDVLEERGLVARQPHAEDRRVYSVQLTAKGQEMMAELGRAARQHNESLCSALTMDERIQLASLLQKIADGQGLTRNVHPGYGAMGSGRPKC